MQTRLRTGLPGGGAQNKAATCPAGPGTAGSKFICLPVQRVGQRGAFKPHSHTQRQRKDPSVGYFPLGQDLLHDPDPRTSALHPRENTGSQLREVTVTARRRPRSACGWERELSSRPLRTQKHTFSRLRTEVLLERRCDLW